MAHHSSDDAVLVTTCNEMLSQLHVLHRVKHWKEINVQIFITLFEGLWGEPLKGVVRAPRTIQEELHNAQLVVDTLSHDVLNASLSHIQGENLVNGDRETIANLLEVFKGLLEYILDKIESDTSSAVDMRDVEEDLDLVTPELIDDILERELSNARTYSLDNSNRSGNLSGYSPSGLENTSELIALGETPSPGKDHARRNQHYGSPNKTGNSTKDLIALGNDSHSFGPGQTTRAMIRETEDIEHTLRHYEQTGVKSVGGQNVMDTQRPKPSPGAESNASSISMPRTESHRMTDSKAFNTIGQRPKQVFSASLPIMRDMPNVTRPANRTSSRPSPSKGPSKTTRATGVSQSQPNPMSKLSATDVPITNVNRLRHTRGKSRSYDSLHTLVNDTVEMSREALRTSPWRQRQSNVNQNSVHQAPGSSRNVSIPENSRSPHGSPSARRKVSFLTGRSSDNSFSGDGVAPGPEVAAVLDRIGDLSLKSDIETFYRNRTRNNNNMGPSASQSEKKNQASHKAAGPRRSLGEALRQSNIEPSTSHDIGGGHSTVADELAPRRQADSNFASTFQEYMEKYYGVVEKRDYPLSDSDLSQHSDGVIDYETTPQLRKNDVRRKVLEDLKGYARKSVRFDDIMDDAAYGQMAPLRRNLKSEDQHTRRKIEALDKMYQFEMNEIAADAYEKLKGERKSARQRDMEYRKKVLKSPKMTKFVPARKYQTSVLRQRPRTKSVGRGRKRSHSASPSVNRRKSPGPIGSDDLLSVLLDEFPHLHLSTETLHELWRKSSHQFERLANAEREVRRRKSKAQVQIEEAQRKQEILANIMRKELGHLQRMRDLKDRQYQTQHVKSKIRDRRLQSARSRKYYEDYQIRMRSKMLKKRTKEELVFKKLFRDAVDIQKNRLRELHKYSKEERSRRAKTQQNQIESMENYYKDQMNMLAEALQVQRQDQEVRSKAQTKVLQQMKGEMRKKMEREIEMFQEQLYRDEDDEYFRQIEADRLRHQLQVSRQAAAI